MNADNMNNNPMPQRANNESIFKFIFPVLIMAGVQILVQIFAGQLMFFYKGYTYTDGTYEEFVAGYQEALVSNYFTMAVTIASTLILVVVFLLWYRREIIHAANVSLRGKLQIIGHLNFKVIPGVILVSAGMGVFASYVGQLVTFIKPDLVVNNNDMISMIDAGNSPIINIILVAYIAFLSPICQELVFRGLTLGFAERRMTFWSANIIQALIFGAMSMNVPQMITNFIFGLVFGYVYYRTENIAIPMVCNMLFCITRIILANINIMDNNMILFYLIFFVAMAAVYLGVVLIKNSKVQKVNNS